MPALRLSSPSRRFFSLVSLAISALTSRRSARGRKAVAKGRTMETVPSPMPSLSAWSTMSEAEARRSKKSLSSSKIFLIPASSDTMMTFALREGATPRSVRAARMARTVSLMVSMACSSAGKLKSSLKTGQSEIMMEASLSWTVQKISSVTKGMKGCRSFRLP